MINSINRSLVSGKKWYRNISAGNPLYSEMELIATTVLSSATGTVTFSAIPTDYKHLQIRIVGRSTVSATTHYSGFRFNNDTSTNYNSHFIQGTGSTVASVSSVNAAETYGPNMPAGTATANAFAGCITDILDYASNSKNKTIRTFTGYTHSAQSEIFLQSGAWRSLSAVTSIDCVSSSGGSWAIGSRFSLYGIKG